MGAKVTYDHSLTTATEYSEELMNLFRKAHPSLGHEIEIMLEEMILRFRPHAEEELLSTIHTLIQRCYQSVLLSLNDPMPPSLKDTLVRVSKKYFRGNSHRSSIDRFRAAFERTFLLDEETGEGNRRNTNTNTAAVNTPVGRENTKEVTASKSTPVTPKSENVEKEREKSTPVLQANNSGSGSEKEKDKETELEEEKEKVTEEKKVKEEEEIKSQQT